MTRLLVSIGALVMVIGTTGSTQDRWLNDRHEVKYVILMVPDGMGALSNVTAADREPVD